MVTSPLTREDAHRTAIRMIRHTMKSYVQYVDKEWFQLRQELKAHYAILEKQEKK